MQIEDFVLDVDQHIDIKAPVEKVFASLLHRISDEQVLPDGTEFRMELEPYPGGRWYRKLDETAGHLWGFVQVIKPPKLLEICGPLFMSYPASGHIAFRLEATDGGTRLSLRHRVVGLIQDDHRQGVVPGWQVMLDDMKVRCE